MLSSSPALLMRHGAARVSAAKRRIRKLTKSSGVVPTREFQKQTLDASSRHFAGSSAPHMAGNRELQADRFRNAQMALQMSGDANSLSRDANFGVSATDVAAHGANLLPHRVTPPESYSPLMARKLTEGRLWPIAPMESTMPNVVEVPNLEPYENLSPSEQRYSTQLEYLVRRNLNGAPAHLIEHIDMSEFVLDRIAVWRRNSTAWFVWTTVSPEARGKIEPYIVQLGPWLKRQVHKMPKRFQYLMPTFRFVYRPSDAMPERLPRSTVKELENVHARVHTSIEERVEKLKSHDTIDARLRGVPWFMPYLWAKDKKLRVAKQSYEDLKTLDERKNGERKPENPGMPNSYRV